MFLCVGVVGFAAASIGCSISSRTFRCEIVWYVQKAVMIRRNRRRCLLS